MPCLQRAVLLRAAAAALALSVALGLHGSVGHALARRGAERAEREASVCAEAARLSAVERATRSGAERRPGLGAVVRPVGCGARGR